MSRARRLIVTVLLASGVLGLAPSDALALRVSLTGADSEGDRRFFHAGVQAEAGETNDLRVGLRDGTIRDDRATIERVGSSADEDCRSSTDRRRVSCPPLSRAVIATGAGDDRITVFGYTCDSRACAFGSENFDSGPEVSIDPGPGRDEVRLDWGGTGEVRLNLRDGARDTVSCNDRPVDLQIRTRDSEDDVRDCPRPRSNTPRGGTDTTAPTASISARRALRRGTALRSGIGTLCSTSEEGTCAVTASISARAARAIGIRTRLRRYTIGRGTASLESGRTRVPVALTARARSALTGRRTRGLRILLTAVVRDAAGNASTKRFTVTLRG